MSNIAKLYTDLTSGPAIEPPVKEEVLDAGLQQLKLNWIQSTITQEVFKGLIEDEKQLLDKAIGLATSSSPDTLKLIQILVRVDTIRRLRTEFSNQQPTKQQ